MIRALLITTNRMFDLCFISKQCFDAPFSIQVKEDMLTDALKYGILAHECLNMGKKISKQSVLEYAKILNKATCCHICVVATEMFFESEKQNDQRLYRIGYFYISVCL